MSDSRYHLTDMENRMMRDEMHVSNLQPYGTIVDGVPLATDEYVVDSLLKRRSWGGQTQYLVKWRGYRREQATWEPRGELMRRCADLVTAFDKDRPTAEPPERRHRPEDEIPVADTATRKLGEPERRPLRTVVDAAGRLLRPRDQVRYVGAMTELRAPDEPEVRMWAE